MTSKRNQTFVYMYALAIIMVIDDHCSARIGFMYSIFPYNSFYMPLFVFASGYFFKKKPLKEVIIRKIKRILVPYIFYDVVMIFLAYVIDLSFGLNWHRRVSAKTITKALFDSPTTEINGAAWFAIMVFWVSVIYCLLRILVKQDIIHDCILTGILILAGLASIYICIHCFFQNENQWLVIRWFCRTFFYLQFYHLGYMFNNYFEELLKSQSKLTICSICVIINVVLQLIYGDDVNFYSTVYMRSFSVVGLPLITSITGIIFYYEVMSFLSDRIGETKVTSFIARNTFTIMQVHLLFVNIPNLYIYYEICNGFTLFRDFPVNEFKNSTWVRHSSNSSLISFFCGLIGSLLVCAVIERTKYWYKLSKFNNKQAG